MIIDNFIIKLKKLLRSKDIRIIKKYQLLDGELYLQQNPDVAQTGIDPIVHYVIYGFKEGRFTFPEDIISYCLGHKDIDLDEGLYSNLQKIISKYNLFHVNRYLLRNSELAVQIEDIKLIKKYKLLDEDLYLQKYPDIGKLDPVVHYVIYGFREGRSAFPEDINSYFLNKEKIDLSEELPNNLQKIISKYKLFHVKQFLLQNPCLAVQLEDIKLIKKYKLLDEDLYLQKYPDIGELDPVVHYVMHGFKEGRTIFPVTYATKNHDIDFSDKIHNKIKKVIRQYRLFDNNLHLMQNPDVAQLTISPLEHYILHGITEGRKLFPEFRLTSMIQKQIDKSVEYEPGIAQIRGIRPNVLAPFHDPLYFLHKEIKARLRAIQYDTIICMPCIHMSGVDLHARQLAQALYRLHPNRSILLLRSEKTNFERPEWFPEGIDTVDLSDLFAYYDSELVERALYAMFSGLNPTRIINVNNLACWYTLKRYGKRLADRVHLYGFLFCWDFIENGVRMGYPSIFFPATGGFLSGVLTDSNFLKEALTDLYAVPHALQSRIFPLALPVNYKIETPTMAECALLSRDLRQRPVVLWAGPLDRQKPLDLVQGIASRMPGVDFHCWGTSIPDDSLDLSKCPPNVSLHPAFRSLDELSLAEADAWLFTSFWEGTPTMLIEVAMKGMPVVASAGGCVPEVINAETGWLIESINDIQAYVACLREVLEIPQIGVKKAINLQHLAKLRYCQEKFDADVQWILSQEKKHG